MTTLGGHRDVDEPERELIRRLGRRRTVLLRSGAVAPTDAGQILDLVK